MHKQKILKITAIILVVIILYLALEWLMPTLTSSQAKHFVKGLGLFGHFFIVFYIVISHVLAPLAGTPGVLLSATLFGIFQTMFYIYLGGLISACINFWISRKFGRKWVAKLVGKKTMHEIDYFTKTSGVKILVISRIFGFALFEIISYAAGLTNINFKKYFWITAVYSLLPASIFALLFRNAELESASTLFFWLGAIIITGAMFSYFIKKFVSSQNQKRDTQL